MGLTHFLSCDICSKAMSKPSLNKNIINSGNWTGLALGVEDTNLEVIPIVIRQNIENSTGCSSRLETLVISTNFCSFQCLETSINSQMAILRERLA